MKAAASAPPSGTDAEEAALWRAFKEDGIARAREKLFALHAAFARAIARRHHRERSRGDIDIADLQQLAYAGLLEALDRFDPARGVPFRPFAAHRISGNVRDGLSRMNEMREQISWRHRIRRERLQSLTEAGADEGTTSEAMAKLTELAVGLALGFMLEGTGLFAPPEGEEQIQPAAETAYDSLAWKQIVIRLHSELHALPERERMILMHHYLDGVGFEELAKLAGVTKGRISQLHGAALMLLRKRLSERGHFRLGK